MVEKRLFILPSLIFCPSLSILLKNLPMLFWPCRRTGDLVSTCGRTTDPGWRRTIVNFDQERPKFPHGTVADGRLSLGMLAVNVPGLARTIE